MFLNCLNIYHMNTITMNIFISGDQEIGNLLDDSDSDQDFEIYPKSAKKGARTAKPTTKTPSKGTTKSSSKAKVEKVEVKAEKKASPKVNKDL